MKTIQNTIIKIQKSNGFTLIELLVVIAIIGVLTGFSLLALLGARAAGRDTRRKSDLEQIRSALEMYRSDCVSYPATLPFGSPFSGCPTSNIYLNSVPKDPQDPTSSYFYSYNSTTKKYTLCARVERGGVSGSCGTNMCGNEACNHMVTNP